jgi:hypothetical protein
MLGHWWTRADSAELDCLLFELVRGYFERLQRCAACQPGDCPKLVAWRQHLEMCKACRGDGPLTHGLPCERYQEFVGHSQTCARCNHCPRVQLAIQVVLEWRERRALLSRAEFLRAERDRLEAAA